jgi:hypothetical protein
MDADESELEQRIIDHEARVTRTQELRAFSDGARERRREQRDANAEERWLREGMISILRAAESEREVRELGLSDEVIREARLAQSLAEAWQRFGADSSLSR